MARTLLHNARIITGDNDFTGYLVIDGDRIAEIGESDPTEELKATCETV